MLTLRCPEHPTYDGVNKPGTVLVYGEAAPIATTGSQACKDCWELYRRVHES